jgi:hypothetical protein
VKFANSLFFKLRKHCEKDINKNRREESRIGEENATILFEGLLLSVIERPNRIKLKWFYSWQFYEQNKFTRLKLRA